MTNEDVILNLTDGKARIQIAINKLTETLCFLAQQDNESEDDRRNLSNIAYSIETLKELHENIKELN